MKHYRRDWLNKREGTAFAESHSRVSRNSKTGKVSCVSGSLSLADCSRTIHLDFDAFSKEEVKERLNKIRILRHHLDALENTLNSAYHEIPTQKEYDKEQKAFRRGLDIEELP